MFIDFNLSLEVKNFSSKEVKKKGNNLRSELNILPPVSKPVSTPKKTNFEFNPKNINIKDFYNIDLLKQTEYINFTEECRKLNSRNKLDIKQKHTKYSNENKELSERIKTNNKQILKQYIPRNEKIMSLRKLPYIINNMVNKPIILSDSETLFPDRYSKDHYNAIEFLKTFQVNNRNFPIPRKLFRGNS